MYVDIMKYGLIPSVGVGEPSLLWIRSLSCGWLTGEIGCGIWGSGPVAKNGKGLKGCIGNPGGVPGPKGPPL